MTSGDRCGNCQALLAGPHCHACGQPVKGMIRPLSGWIADFFDSVFNWDARVPRTLVPLLLRPGFVTCEYLAGRRVRYVTPVRLFLFLTIVLFIAVRLFASFDFSGADLDRRVQLAPAQDDRPRIERLVAWLPERERATVLADVLQPPAVPEQQAFQFSIGDDENDPVAIGWLPDSVNAQLTVARDRFTANARRISQDPTLFFEQVLATAPQILFFMLPVFALLLKVFYLFKRRLYSEHLLVALHSHAFIALALLLILALTALRTAAAGVYWLTEPLFWFSLVLAGWIPVNLLLTQKRVYGQGWTLTILKFLLLGLCYVWLLALGFAAAILLSVLFW